MSISSEKSVLLKSGTGFSQTALAVFDLMNSEPDLATRLAMNTLINTLVADGNWADLDVFVWGALDTEANSLSDWKGVQNGLGVSAIVWSSANGFEGDGIADYINSQVDLNTLTLYAQDNASAHVFVNDNRSVVNGDIVMGVEVGTTRTFAQQTGSSIIYRINQSSISTNNTDNLFIDGSNYALFRDAGATAKFYINGALTDTETDASVGVPTGQPVYILANNDDGVAEDFIDCSTFGYCFGRTLTNMASFNTAIEQFKTDLGI